MTTENPQESKTDETESLEEVETVEEIETEEEPENNYDELVAALEKANKEVEKFKHFNRKLESEKRELQTQVLKTSVIKEFGLPEGTEALLEGKNEEELKAKATALKNLLGANKEPQQQVSTPNPLAGLNEEVQESKDNELGLMVKEQLSNIYKK